ncbi:MAG: hypothetical protein R3F39_07130 [Myxococcota bacterium]
MTRRLALASPTTRRSIRPSEVLHEGQGWAIRRSRPTDALAVSELLREVPFGGEFPVVEERQEDAFALRNIRTMDAGSAPDIYIVESQGFVAGSACVVVRPGAATGGIVPLAHLTDVRLRPELRAGKVLPTLLRIALEDVRVRLGAELAVMHLLDRDHVALAPFIRRSRERYEQPMAQVAGLTDLLLIPLGRHTDIPRHFSAAAHHDLPELGTFISARQASRRFAEPVSIETLAHELTRLPDQRVDHTFMMRDATGALSACLTVVDTGRFRRFVPLQPTGWARAESLVQRSASALGLAPAAPGEGETAEVLWVSTIEARGDEPARLQALLEGVLAAHAESSWDWLGVALPRGPQTTALAQALRATTFPISVLVLSLAGTRWNNVDLRAPRVRVNAAFL